MAIHDRPVRPAIYRPDDAPPAKSGKLITTRLPPANVDVEIGVLGSIMLDPDIADVHEIMMFLKSEHFYRATHQTVFRAIANLYNAGKPIDLLTVCDELVAMGEYDAIGGDEELGRMIDAVPHAKNGCHYAFIVNQKAKTRQTIEAADKVVEAGYSQAMSAEALIQLAETEVFQLSAD